MKPRPHIEIDVSTSPDSPGTSSSYRQSSKVASVIISGVGFLADAYDLFVIDFVVAILVATAYVEPTPEDKGLIVSSTLAGAVIGQLFFGVAADFFGRKFMFITTAFLVICGSVLSSLVGWGYTQNIQTFNIFHQLAICRFILGCGIGGEYPLSATVASENETEEELMCGDLKHKQHSKGCLWYLSHKPNSIAAVFSMQGVGMLLSPLIVMLCIVMGLSLESTWRLCLSVGAIPSAIAFFFRWKMHETAAFKRVQQDYSLAESAATAVTANYKVSYASPLQATALEKSMKYMVENTVSPCPFISDEKKEKDLQLKAEETTTSKITPPLNDTSTKQSSSSSSSVESTESAFVVQEAAFPLSDDPPQPYIKFESGSQFEQLETPSLSITLKNQFEQPMEKALSKQSNVCLKQQSKFSWKAFGLHVKRSLGTLKHLKYVILGTSATWFLIDVTLYGTGSFKSAIVGKWFLDERTLLSQKSMNPVLLPNHTSHMTEHTAIQERKRKLFVFSDIMYENTSQKKAEKIYRDLDFDTSQSLGQYQRNFVKKIISSHHPSYFSSNKVTKLNSKRHLSKENYTTAASLITVRQKVMRQAQMGAIVAFLAIPGYILSLLFIHKIGTQQLQLWGFVAVALVFITLGIEQLLVNEQGVPFIELFLFGLTFLCSNFGPNTTTFIIPTQVYPTIVRATCHGFSAAMGKLGGVVGTSLFSIIELYFGLGWLLIMCGFVSIFGVLFTFFIPKNLEAIKYSIGQRFQSK